MVFNKFLIQKLQYSAKIPSNGAGSEGALIKGTKLLLYLNFKDAPGIKLGTIRSHLMYPRGGTSLAKMRKRQSKVNDRGEARTLADGFYLSFLYYQYRDQ